MNKKELIAAMQEEGLTKSEAMRAIEGFIAAVTKAVLRGERVVLFGFGTFSRMNYRPRIGRNLSTGEKVIVPAHSTVAFRSGKQLCDQINSKFDEITHEKNNPVSRITGVPCRERGDNVRLPRCQR